MTDQPARLLPDTDRLSGPAQQPAPVADGPSREEEVLVNRTAAHKTMDVLQRGGDPLTQVSPLGGPIPWRVELEHRWMFEKQRNKQMNDSIFANPESGWQGVKGAMDKMFEQYRAQNEAQLIKKPRNEEEYLAQAQQMRPVVMDPNELAELRQAAVQIDADMKAIDPRTSFWTDPRTKKYADWLNREAGGGGYGYLTSGEQELNIGAVGTAAMAGAELVEGAGDFGTNLAHGLWDLGRQGIEAVGGPNIGALTPTNYIEGEDGKLYDNGGKAPGFLDSMTMMWASATDRNVQKEVAKMGRTRELEVAGRNGFQTIALGASRIAGMGVGFGLPAGAAMKGGAKVFGNLTQKGLTSLGALKLGQGVAQSERALKIVRTMGGAMGAAVGNGMAESAAFGRVDGYGKSFMHGMAMAPVLMTLGALGRRTEWFARHRVKMPAKAAALIGQGMEGVGFGAMEAHFPDLLPAAWGFIKNPNEETWQTYSKNVAGFMMFSIASRGQQGVSPGRQMLDATQQQMARGSARAAFAEQVARGEASPEAMARAPSGEAQLRDLGKTSAETRSADPEVRSRARESLKEKETDLDVAELGVEGAAEREVSGGLERLAEPSMEELRAQLSEAKTPEMRQAAIEAIRKREQRDAPAGDRVELGEGQNLEFRDSQTGVEGREWVVRGADGEIIGAGSFTPKEGGKAEIHNAEIRPEHRGKGVYTKVVEQLKKQFPGGLESVHQEPGARRAHEKAASREASELPGASMRGGDAGEIDTRRGVDAVPREVVGGIRKALRKDFEAEVRANPEVGELLDTMLRAKLEEKHDMPVGEVTKRLEGSASAEDFSRGRGYTDAEIANHQRAFELLQKMEPSLQNEIMVSLSEALGQKAEGYRYPASVGDVAGRSFRSEARSILEGFNQPQVEARKGVVIGPGGERAGPQSFQVPPTRQVEATPGTQPVRASDVFLEMEGRRGRAGVRVPFTAKRVGATAGDPVRVAARSGKIGGPELGHFRFFENMMRTQEGRDLVVGSHEWAHAMHRHTIANQGKDFQAAAKLQVGTLPAEVRAEIDQVLKDYPKADKLKPEIQWMEAFAEWHARNMLGEVGLDQKLPALSRYFRRWLAQPEQAAVREQYSRIQDMLYRYNAQGAEERVRQSIVLETDPATASERAARPPLLQRASDAVTKAMFDDMVELKRSQDRWLEASGRKPEDVQIGDDPARMYDALRMTSTKTAEHFVMRGIRLPTGELVPGLRSHLEPVVKEGREDFYKYVVARRNLELHGRGKTTQLPPQDYVETIKAIESRHPGFREAAEGIKRWTDALVDYVARSGNMDAESAARIKDASALYVPFFRAMEGPRQHGQGRGVAERGTGLANIKGSTFEVRDPLVSLQEVAGSMIAKAHQNQVMTAMYKMSQGQEAGGLASVVPKSKVPTDHPVAQMLNAIERKIEVPEQARETIGDVFDLLRDIDSADPQVITTFAQKVVPTGERAIVAYTPRLTPKEIDHLVSEGAHRPTLEAQNGKLQWLELDTQAYEALMGIDKMPHLPEGLQGVMQIARAPRDLVRFFATGVSPGFTVANLIRDAITEPMFSRDGRLRPFGGFVNLIRGAIEYHKNGEMRELYEELGVKTSSFFNEGMRREVAGQASGFRAKFLEMTGRVQEFFAHPENYLRMAKFKDAYNAAKKDGKPEEVARLEALEEGRELMNFARAGVISRMLNQMIPYFNAGLVGKRKFYGQLLYGGDVKGDVAKARVQRAALLNGLANITAPTLALWFMNKDEEWYQDLPDWRKVNYWNVKMYGEIVSIPKPFEAGTIFGTLPEILLDKQVEDGNPAAMKTAAEVALGSYMEGIGTFIPAFLRPIVEVTANYDFFRGRQLTPEWIERTQKPSEQSTFYTTATARILSQAVNGALSPIEIEQLLGGYTAGFGTSAMRSMDEIAGLKEHPLGMPMPWSRFFKQTEHGQSAFVTQLYDLSRDLDQRRDELTSQEQGLRRRVNAAKRRISSLRKSSRSGTMPRSQAERQAFELARPLVEEMR